ncbi:MAG: hypothetical protein PHU85_08495 [Phycisphaerae bacterium]|nr:hypothetical protein [Phycisphaerae bacterium]
MIIRLWPSHHKNESALDELMVTLARHRRACDEVWFCTEFGVPTLEAHRRSADAMARAADRVRREGFLAGLQIANSIGHTLAAPRDGLAWQRMVYADGQVSKECNCPRDPLFHEYFREMMRAYAAWQPSSVWIDDDLRLNIGPPMSHGCFCERCLAVLGEGRGNPISRESLVAALTDPKQADLRRSWCEFGQRSLAVVAGVVAEAVHAVSPKTMLGLQHCGPSAIGVYHGLDWAPVLESLSAKTGLPSGSRPGGGFYDDEAPRGMIRKALDIGFQVARLPKCVSHVCPEIENFAHVAMGKTPHGTAVESTLYLAMGCNALSYAILCSASEPMSWYAGLIEKLAAWRPFWERFVDDSQGAVPGGLDMALGLESSHAGRDLLPGEPPFKSWSGIDISRILTLATWGIPLCASGEGAQGAILTAGTVSGLRRKDLERLLSGGVLADGAAVFRLHELGYGDMLGVASRRRAKDSPEYFTSDPANGSHGGYAWDPNPWLVNEVYELTAASGSARVLGEYRNAAGDRAGVATMLVETPLGGRLAVFGNAGWAGGASSARRFQIFAAADWVSRERLPVVIEDAVQVMAVPRVRADGRIATVALLNVTIDKTPGFRVRLRSPGVEQVEWVLPDQLATPLAIERLQGEVAVSIPPMAPWTIGYLRLRENAQGRDRERYVGACCPAPERRK